jgi:hypothetical protein
MDLGWCWGRGLGRPGRRPGRRRDKTFVCGIVEVWVPTPVAVDPDSTGQGEATGRPVRDVTLVSSLGCAAASLRGGVSTLARTARSVDRWETAWSTG